MIQRHGTLIAALALLLWGIAGCGGPDKKVSSANDKELAALKRVATNIPDPGRSPPAARSGPLPKLKLCTGPKPNRYYRTGAAIAQLLTGVVDVELITTKGSWDNLRRLDKTPRDCDAAIAQDDAFALYQFEKPNSVLAIERVVSLYPEYIHLLCNRSAKLDDVFDLKPGRDMVLVNEFGSGTYITWTLFGKMNAFYSKVSSIGVPIEEGLLKVVDGVAAQCMVMVAGLNVSTLIDAQRRFGDRLELIDISDKRLRKRVGRHKRRVYHQSTIDEGVYNKLLDHDLDTPAVDAVFFVSPEWKIRYPAEFQQLAGGLLRLVPRLREDNP